LTRAGQYARLLASIGINGCTINNVNAAPQILEDSFIAQVSRIADVFRPWGVQLSLSVDLSSPKVIGSLDTFDPLDPRVAEWWRKKVDEIYRSIPDFGGFVVKADSEGRLGPSTYGRTPADAANVIARALKPHGGVVFYRATRQRARVAVDDALVRETEETIAAAWQTARSGEIPAPLIDSPKCPGCSLAGICLPDETASLTASDDAEQLALFATRGAIPRKPPAAVRRLVTPRSDLRPVYLNTQGLRVGKSGNVLQMREKDAVVQEARVGEICQVNLMGNVQISTQAVQGLCEADVPICYFSMGGWFYGITTGLNVKNVFLRQAQFRLADTEWFTLKMARALVAGKIRNQRTMLQRNHVEPRAQDLLELRRMAEAAEEAGSDGQLLGVEGNAARVYFSAFSGMLKAEDGETVPEGFRFDFEGRNRRPPRDPVNALLSLAYSLLTKDFTIACYAVGFDPYMGFYHKPRFGRPALALDLMEPFRSLIADSAVLTAINTRMVTERDFVRAGPSVALTPSGRKGFFRAYEMRMDTLITHPLFDYRVSYRRLLEIEARLVARVVTGEIGSYRAFTTR